MTWQPTTSGIASVWDWSHLRYDYYRIPEPRSVGGWVELEGLGRDRGLRAAHPVGVPVEAVLRSLPSGSRWVGRGAQAVGEVMVGSGATSGLGQVETGDQPVASRQPPSAVEAAVWLVAIMGILAGGLLLAGRLVEGTTR